ncbi:MAG: PAS domain S-box protein [Rhodospirillales bacterium]|nr:MAG: PAS domain S-box protein [Rhodospirillales bacterium]
MDMFSPKSRQELETEVACLKSRLSEYEALHALNRETGEAFLRSLGGFEICKDRLDEKSEELCAARHAMQQALNRYTGLFNNSPIGYFLIDHLGIVREANLKGAALLGTVQEHLKGMPFAKYISPLSRPGFEHHLSMVFTGNCGQIELTLEAEGTPPLPVILETSMMERIGQEETPLCLVAALDLSSRKAAEKALAERTEELARSNQDLERFAYVISHDLQEPLRNIGNYVQFLARRYKGRLDADADEFIGYVVDGVARLSNMIRELLSFSRITTQGQELQPIDSGSALKDALSNLESAITESGAEIKIEAMPRVLADPTQLTSLLQNLIGNAVKYRDARRKPLILIATRPIGEQWMFSITDNGIGIESRQFERMFTLFHRIDPHGTVPGSGIGLAVCKRIVERHGGQLWVESTPGQGSVFYFTLTAAPAPSP